MNKNPLVVYAVLLAGGTGTRLWPVSRELSPKQLVKFIGQDSLIQSTIKRLSPVIDADRIRVVCGKEHFNEIARHMEKIGIEPNGKILSEPCGRNTAPAILLSILKILSTEADAVLCVFPADHVIKDTEGFHDKIKASVRLAKKGHVVTFGIQPHYPETGYGYIEGAEALSEGAFAVKRFVEKPDIDTARKYLAAGHYFWNSGMFTFRASVMLEEFAHYQPEILSAMQSLNLDVPEKTQNGYELLPNISIDYAIMERTQKGAVLPSDFGWSDIGSWKSLYDFLPKDYNGNVFEGDIIAEDTKDCFVMGHDRLIATNRLRNMVVVETPDAIFVSDLENSRNVKSLVQQIKKTGRWEHQRHRSVHHEWGTFTLLEKDDDYRVAKLVVYPGKSIRIKARRPIVKHISMTGGQAALISDNQQRLLKTGDSVEISENRQVELQNTGSMPLQIVQVRIGRDSDL